MVGSLVLKGEVGYGKMGFTIARDGHLAPAR